MAEGKTRLPSSYGGIMRYFEDYKSKILIKPGHVIFFTIIMVIVVIAIHIIAPPIG